MLKGGSVEKRWQPMSADRWNLPVSRSRIFMAENTGRSGQPTQKPGGRCGSVPSSCAARSFSDLIGATAWSRPRNFEIPVSTTSPVYSPANGSRPAHVDLLLLLQVSRRRQADAVVIEVRVLDQRALR